MGYTNYPNNVVHKFCKQAYKSGVDVLRVFNSLNYTKNLKLGVDAGGGAGGFMEGPSIIRGAYRTPTRSIIILSITSI